MRVRHEPFHRPIGFSAESYGTSRRWLLLLVAVVTTLGAGVAAVVRLPS